MHKILLPAQMGFWRETREKSVRNEVQNGVTGAEKGVTRVTVDRIHGERLMWWGEEVRFDCVTRRWTGPCDRSWPFLCFSDRAS
jgi:hypothetical protein